jgi:hypothetical protein
MKTITAAYRSLARSAGVFSLLPRVEQYRFRIAHNAVRNAREAGNRSVGPAFQAGYSDRRKGQSPR